MAYNEPKKKAVRESTTTANYVSRIKEASHGKKRNSVPEIGDLDKLFEEFSKYAVGVPRGKLGNEEHENIQRERTRRVWLLSARVDKAVSVSQ